MARAFVDAVVAIRPGYTDDEVDDAFHRMAASALSKGLPPDLDVAALASTMALRVDKAANLGGTAASGARAVPPARRLADWFLSILHPSLDGLGWTQDRLSKSVADMVARNPGLAIESVEAREVALPLMRLAEAKAGMRRHAVLHMLDVAPLPDPPSKVAASWLAGDLAAGRAWLLARHTRALLASLDGLDVTGLADLVRQGSEEAVPPVDHATRKLSGTAAHRAMSLFVSFPGTAEDAHALGVAYQVTHDARTNRLECERRASEAAKRTAEAQRRRVEDEERRLLAAIAPVPKFRVPELIGATKAEVDRWVADGRIPTHATVSFHKWGRWLETTEHSTPVLLALKGKVEGWRKAETAVTRDRRSAASKATAGARRAKAFRSRVAVQAGATMIPGLDGHVAIPGVPIAPPTDAPDLFTPLATNGCLPWPDGYGGTTKTGKPVSERTGRSLAKALRAACAAAGADLTAAASAAARHGASTVAEAGFHTGDAVRARMRHHIDRALEGLGRADVAHAEPAHLGIAVRDAFAKAL